MLGFSFFIYKQTSATVRRRGNGRICENWRHGEEKMIRTHMGFELEC